MGFQSAFKKTKSWELQGNCPMYPCHGKVHGLPAIGWNVLYTQKSPYVNSSGFFNLPVAYLGECNRSEMFPSSEHWLLFRDIFKKVFSHETFILFPASAMSTRCTLEPSHAAWGCATSPTAPTSWGRSWWIPTTSSRRSTSSCWRWRRLCSMNSNQVRSRVHKWDLQMIFWSCTLVHESTLLCTNSNFLFWSGQGITTLWKIILNCTEQVWWHRRMTQDKFT